MTLKIPNPDKEYARFVRAVRGQLEITQEQLGELLGRSKGNVSAWEQGRHEPSLEQIERMSELSGLPYSGLQHDLRPFLPYQLPINAQVLATYLSNQQKDSAWLGEQLNVGSKAVSKWIEIGLAPRNHVTEIARILQLPLKSLLAREEDANWLEGLQKEIQNLMNTPGAKVRDLTTLIRKAHEPLGDVRLSSLAFGPEIQGQVPIISWVQAGSFADVVDNQEPGQAEAWTNTTCPIHRHTYALRVNGDSMWNPSGDPSFPHGSVVVVEPDAITDIQGMAGKLVIWKRPQDEEATFKKLVRDGGDFLLVPLNPQYPTLRTQEGDVCCGVVREKVQRFF